MMTFLSHFNSFFQDPGKLDSGLYKCNMKNPSGELNANLTLNIESKFWLDTFSKHKSLLLRDFISKIFLFWFSRCWSIIYMKLGRYNCTSESWSWTLIPAASGVDVLTKYRRTKHCPAHVSFYAHSRTIIAHYLNCQTTYLNKIQYVQFCEYNKE